MFKFDAEEVGGGAGLGGGEFKPVVVSLMDGESGDTTEVTDAIEVGGGGGAVVGFEVVGEDGGLSPVGGAEGESVVGVGGVLVAEDLDFISTGGEAVEADFFVVFGGFGSAPHGGAVLVIEDEIEVAEGVVEVDAEVMTGFADAGGFELEPVSIAGGVDGEGAEGGYAFDGFKVVGFGVGVVGGGFCPIPGGV